MRHALDYIHSTTRARASALSQHGPRIHPWHPPLFWLYYAYPVPCSFDHSKNTKMYSQREHNTMQCIYCNAIPVAGLPLFHLSHIISGEVSIQHFWLSPSPSSRYPPHAAYLHWPRAMVYCMYCWVSITRTLSHFCPVDPSAILPVARYALFSLQRLTTRPALHIALLCIVVRHTSPQSSRARN